MDKFRIKPSFRINYDQKTVEVTELAKPYSLWKLSCSSLEKLVGHFFKVVVAYWFAASNNQRAVDFREV
ncbi:hypothetical protein [Xanthovirga aplysinae]|uniref:hypothetical protein n=1 Tax=Xanthovirga aplysinae TaxID=2529853 RepID=UPI0012BBA2D4|nr:hypothetical protein [Xanthovirga aplysinae]MTI31084.1 hypothetical protein [Xanthovirga aplysinae]